MLFRRPGSATCLQRADVLQEAAIPLCRCCRETFAGFLAVTGLPLLHSVGLQDLQHPAGNW